MAYERDDMHEAQPGEPWFMHDEEERGRERQVMREEHAANLHIDRKWADCPYCQDEEEAPPLHAVANLTFGQRHMARNGLSITELERNHC